MIGAGVAGLTSALAAADAGAEVVLVTPGSFNTETGAASALAGGNTALAQGGIAAAISPADSPALHAADTVAAGAGLVDLAAAELLTTEGAKAVLELIAAGFAVDRDPVTGEVALGLEGAHSMPRIVHSGEDRTGASLHHFLTARMRVAREAGRITLIESSAAVSLFTDNGLVSGALLRGEDGELSAVRADATVIATGGYGALYAQSTNHSGARGEGVLLAARAGALIADLEFVQFHPTVLANTGLLISEAVRGAGAVLRDRHGVAFMQGVHEAADLAPRDVVSRAIHRVLAEQGPGSVWLDATSIERELGAGTLERRFPKLTDNAKRHGFDWAHEPVPVAPAAHYTMGGVVTDLHGRASVPGLFVVGEASSTGVHGANRLASNSLLEGLVFGARAAHAALAFADRSNPAHGEFAAWHLGAQFAALQSAAGVLPVFEGSVTSSAHTAESGDEAALKLAVDAHLGIERDASGIQTIRRLAAQSSGNLAEMVKLIAHAAAKRTESRGAQLRSDFTATDPAQAHRNTWLMPANSRETIAHPRQGTNHVGVRADERNPQGVPQHADTTHHH